MLKKKSSTWIGLIKVEALKGCRILGDDKMAFSNAVGFAISKHQFRDRVKKQLSSLGLKLIRLEDAEPLSDRLKIFIVHRNIMRAVKRLSETNTVDFGTFHTYPE